MPDDDLPLAPSESADEAAKAETIRITLPAKPETPTAKRETVRINLPGKMPGTGGVTPKKETTKIVTESAASATPAAPMAPPVATSRPGVPPPPRPPGAVGAPPPPAKPLSGINPPPKPPMLGKPGLPMKPGIPTPGLKPAPPTASGIRPPASGSGIQAPEPVTQRAAAPKKETARITLPAEGSKPGLPKATVKMQQTQPLVRQPSASTIQSAPMIQTAPASVSSMSSAPASDGILNFLAIITFVVAIGAALLAYLAYSTSLLS
jgi:hypothetical protein